MHKLLLRQLRAAAKSDSKEVDLHALSAIVDQTYAEFDRERRLNDRAATLMEEELKAANAQAKREHDVVLAAILGHASDGMLVIGQGGSVVIANAAAERQFGAPTGGLAGLSLGRLLGAEAHRVAQGEYPAGELPELSGTTLDGRVFPVEFSCANLDMADGQRQLWIVRDISERVRAQREIMESRMRFQDFAEASSDCFWEMDHTLCHVEVSSAAESDLVTRLPSLLTPGPGSRVPPGVAEDSWRALRQHLSARQRFRLRLDLKGDDGETLYVSVSGKPAFDLEGRFSGYRGTARDVTRELVAREAARRAERRLIEAMDAAPCAVALVDSQLQLVSGNSALRNLASAKEKRLPFGRSFCAFLSTSLNVEAMSAEILRRLADTGEMREVEIGGSWYLVAACGLSDGGMVLTFSDVSVLKEREGELAEAKMSAESASRLEVAIPGHHEPRTAHAPQRHTRLLRGDPRWRLRPHRGVGREICRICRLDPYQRTALAGADFGDSRPFEDRSGKLRPRHADGRSAGDGAGCAHHHLARRREGRGRSSIHLPDAEVWFSADERAMRQIAINLLANAVKFTPRGGRVTVEVNSADSMVEFAVSDTGIGIAQEHLPTVFEPFRQVDSSIRRRHEGTGLGLAITKRLVELHGGTITLESELAVGTKVRVRLPGRLAEVDFAATKGAAA